MLIQRKLMLEKILQQKSCFLLGPRQTGKSTLLKQQFPQALTVNLLESETYQNLIMRPQALRELKLSPHQILIIDEIQRIPHLLNEVQILIEEKKSIAF